MVVKPMGIALSWNLAMAELTLVTTTHPFWFQWSWGNTELTNTVWYQNFRIGPTKSIIFGSTGNAKNPPHLSSEGRNRGWWYLAHLAIDWNGGFHKCGVPQIDGLWWKNHEISIDMEDLGVRAFMETIIAL